MAREARDATPDERRWFGLPPTPAGPTEGPWEAEEKRVLWIAAPLIALALVCTAWSLLSENPWIQAVFAFPDEGFWRAVTGSLTGIWFTLVLLGWLVDRWGVNVAITRKFGHILGNTVFPLLVTQQSLQGTDYYHGLYTTAVWRSLVVGILAYGILIRPLRQRFGVLRVAMRAIDREEDRPHTLMWFILQMVAIQLFLVGMTQYFVHAGAWELFLIPAFANGLGDGLAEPLGKRFGKRKYQVGALFTGQRFTRSYVGSGCVAFFTALPILICAPGLSGAQFWTLLIVLPPLLTWIEARAPHTLDNPFMYLACWLVIAAVL